MNIRRLLALAACAAAATLAPVTLFAQAPPGGPGPVLGIVEIPDLFVIDTQSANWSPRRRVTLAITPDPDTQVATTISWPDELETSEYGYEERGAVVYRRERGQYLVKTVGGRRGWLHSGDAGPFHPFETLIAKGLTYLTDELDGFVSASPDSKNRTRVPRNTLGRNNEDVTVKGFRTVSTTLWVEIEVLSHSICISVEPSKITARGWVPAHAASGAPMIWFSSRGC